MRCKRCGKMMGSKDLFCRNCGEAAGTSKKKKPRRILIYCLSLLFLFVLAHFILPTNENGDLIWSQWYRPIIVFGPFLIAGFYDKIFLLFRRSSKNDSEEETPKNTVSYDDSEKPTVKIETHGYKSIWDDPEKSLEERNAAYLAMRDMEIERLNAAYDFNSVAGIRSIPVPCREVNGGSATGRVEYYLRGQCFAKHRDAGDIDLAAECIVKAHDLMFISDMIWKYDSFISDISWLHSVGKHDLARREEKRVDDFFQKNGYYPKLTRKDFSDSSSFEAWKKTISDMESDRIRKRALRHEYYWLQEFLPNLCPKSLSGYARMKNANSKNYQKLVAEAAKLGKTI